MTSLQTVSPFAFVSSWGHSLEKLPKRFSSLEDHINIVLSSCKEEGSIGYQLEQLLGNDKEMSEVMMMMMMMIYLPRETNQYTILVYLRTLLTETLTNNKTHKHKSIA